MSQEWTNLVFIPRFELIPRKGFLCKLFDRLFPRYKENANFGFVAIDKNGEVARSSDGSTWTVP